MKSVTCNSVACNNVDGRSTSSLDSVEWAPINWLLVETQVEEIVQ